MSAREPLGIWLASIALSAVFGVLALFVPFMADNLLAFVAATFLYLPAWILWRRGKDLADYGLKAAPIGHGLLLFVAVVVVVMPPFYLGHHQWQRLLFDRAPNYSRTTFARFSRDLDDRPALPVASDAAHVWIEGGRLVVLWGGDGDADVTISVETTETDADPIRELRGLRQTEDGRLLRHGRAAARVSHAGVLTATLRSGTGLSFNAAGVESFTVETGAPGIRTGRYGVAAEPPLEERRTTWWWLLMFGTQLVLVAVPEEWFYRGYLQQRFDEVWAPRWRIMGAQLGWGWLLASVLFAAGHLVLDARPERLAVFFPSLLFGWMRARTGSVMASSLFHAFSNVWIQTLGYIYIA